MNISINITGSLDQSDRRAMEAQIDQWNELHLNHEGFTPLSYRTAAERKNSYETILSARLIEVHSSYVA